MVTICPNSRYDCLTRDRLAGGGPLKGQRPAAAVGFWRRQMTGSRPCGAAGAGAPRPQPLGAGGGRRAVGTSTLFSPSRRRAPSLLLSPPPSLPTPTTSSCRPRPKLRATPSAAAGLPAAGRCWSRRRRAGKDGAAAGPAEHCRRGSGRRRQAAPGRLARAAGRKEGGATPAAGTARLRHCRRRRRPGW